MRRGRNLVAVLALAIAAVAVRAPGAGAAEPPAGSVSPSSPTITWRGTVTRGGDIPAFTCYDPSIDPTCDAFDLTVDTGGGDFVLDLGVVSGNGADIDVEVYGPDGEYIDGSYTPEAQEHVTVDDVGDGTYRVITYGYEAPPDTPYEGTAGLRQPPAPPPTGGGPESVLWDHHGAELQATVDVPLRVVAVGFSPGELDERRVFAEIPDWQQPGVIIPYDFDREWGDEHGPLSRWVSFNHARYYFRESEPPLLPIEMRWKPELVYAPSSFTAGLFDAMRATETTGRPTYANFLERYNATRGHYRTAAGGEPVAARREVSWYDAERVEDWIAAHVEGHLGFPTGKDPGEPGFTVFLLNTWDAPEVAGRIPADRYHYFKISRPDPDTGQEAGIDWARLWGGRYRFLMIDLGAAPNGWEAEMWDNVSRGVFGSAAFDPPLWEFRANAPRPVAWAAASGELEQAVTPGATWDDEQLHASIARMVSQAASFRFLHSYLYEPRPGVGRFYLSDNVWHDATALIRTDLPRLYDQATALRGLRSLTPYFEFDGDVVFERLDQPDGRPEHAADQRALDDAKAAHNHESMSSRVVMDYLDASPARFLRGGKCATTVPTMQAVVPGHYGWEGPLVAGIATQRNGRPWGFLSSVNDLFKWGGADEDETLRHVHSAWPLTGTFTYVTIHETSHYLGLAHPHDTIGAARHADGAPRYYDGFAWTYDSTAAPTTYSHSELIYNVLDQENIARGHLAYYLSWTDDALREGGVAFHGRGITRTAELPAQAQVLRRLATERSAAAERLYGEFRFVDATFAARDAWKAAATYHDLAVGEPVGTAELAKGTKLVEGDEATICAKGGNVPAAAPGGTIPATGGGPAPLALTALAALLAAAAGLRRAVDRGAAPSTPGSGRDPDGAGA